MTRACFFLLILFAQRAHAQEMDARDADAFTHYRGEPTVDQVVAHALRHSSLDPERARSLMSRARLSGLMPETRMLARRGVGQDLYAYQGSEIDRTNYSTANQLAFEGILYFRLHRLVFAREEVNLLREEGALVVQRNELVRNIIHLYFERRRLQLEQDFEGRIELDRVARIAEATAILDALTGGAFARSTAPRD